MENACFELTFDEAVVVLEWVRREVLRRQGASLANLVEDPSELKAPNMLAEALEVALAPHGADWRRHVAASRARLDPAETALFISAAAVDDAGSEITGRGDGETMPGLSIELDPAATLVLFDFLCREVDDRNGERLAPALVSPGEYWALNSLQCVLEKGTFYSAVLDYAQQLAQARQRIAAT